MFKVPEKSRITYGEMASCADYGNNGAFGVVLNTNVGKGQHGKRRFHIIASDGDDWEHVSVSLPDRTPTWGEMCVIKGMFWGEDDCVVQYHPPKSDYINNHPYCLHLWRPIGIELPRPDSILVGIK